MLCHAWRFLHVFCCTLPSCSSWPFFPCATPSFGLLNVTESEAPVDQDESSEEEAISVQARTRVGRDQPGLRLLVPVHGGLSLATASIASLPHSGHRLSNNLLAPLRC